MRLWAIMASAPWHRCVFLLIDLIWWWHSENIWQSSLERDLMSASSWLMSSNVGLAMCRRCIWCNCLIFDSIRVIWYWRASAWPTKLGGPVSWPGPLSSSFLNSLTYVSSPRYSWNFFRHFKYYVFAFHGLPGQYEIAAAGEHWSATHCILPRETSLVSIWHVDGFSIKR